MQIVNGEMVMFVWLEGPTSGRVEWRSTCLENGALSLTLTGLTMMQEWSVASWATSNLVNTPSNILLSVATAGEIVCR